MPYASPHDKLPEVASPRGRYAACVRSGPLLFTAGQTPRVGGTLLARGRLGREIDVRTAQSCFRQALLNALAALVAAGPALASIRVVVIRTFVACVPEARQLVDVVVEGPATLAEFGLLKPPACVLVGVTALPDNAPVEVELLAFLESPAQSHE